MEDYTCEGCACDCGSCDEKQTIKVLSVVIASLIAIVMAFGIGFAVGVAR